MEKRIRYNDVHTVEIEMIPTEFKLRVYFSDNRDSLDQWIQKLYKTYDNINEYMIGFTEVLKTKEDECRTIVIVLSTLSRATMVHELNHAIDKWGELIGHDFGRDSTELKSYYLGYLFDIVNNMFNNIERPEIDPFKV